MSKFVSMIMMVAFVFTTMMPAASHASMHQHDAIASSAVVDCDHRGAEKTASHSHAKNQTGEKPCCDQGMCKCLNGSCHGGLAAIPTNNATSLLDLASDTTRFGFTDANLGSALTDRLQRPPRA